MIILLIRPIINELKTPGVQIKCIGLEKFHNIQFSVIMSYYNYVNMQKPVRLIYKQVCRHE